MTANDSTASSTTKKTTAEQETNIYKTLFMVTAPITALLAGACVWMGVQLSSTSPASQATPAASASAQLPANETNAEPSQTNPNNLAIMESFMRHDAAGAHGDNFAFLRLLLGGVRNDQAGGGGLLGLNLADDDAVLEGLDGDRHCRSLSSLSRRCSSFPCRRGGQVQDRSRVFPRFLHECRRAPGTRASRVPGAFTLGETPPAPRPQTPHDLVPQEMGQ